MSLELTPAEVDIEPPAAEPIGIRPLTLWVMAAACGTAAANIYYNQPLLNDFAAYFRTDASHAGLVATAAQVGYGLGILFFVPLGDRLERRRIVLTLGYACVALLLATALAPTLITLAIAQLFVGVTAMSAQLLIPLAVDLSPPQKRGHTVGMLMAGLLCGILLARTLGGIVGDHFGWRAMYYLAAALMLTTVVVLQATLPHRRPVSTLPYGRLMASLLDLVKTQPKLRTASVVSGCSFAAFTMFWTVLSFLMKDRFGRGATEAGLFGIVGLAGAMAAPLAGKISDKRGPAFTVTIAVALSIVAFTLMWAWVTIPVLIVGVLVMDLGVQSVQVAAQSEVMALLPEARSRMNTVYMVARFIGGAGGSAAGAFAYAHGGWPAACATAVGVLTLGAIVHLAGTRSAA